jgi:hypothetical protein
MTTADGAVIGTTQVFGSAPRNRAFNIVLLGDGFTADQQAAFDAAVGSFVTAFTSTPPFDDLTPAINVFRVNVRSTDSGADDPASAGGTGRHGPHVLRRHLRRGGHPPAAAVRHRHRADHGRRAGAGVHPRPARRQLHRLRRRRRVRRHLLPRGRGHRDRDPRGRSHGVRPGRRVPLLGGRQRARPGQPPRSGAHGRPTSPATATGRRSSGGGRWTPRHRSPP